MELRPDLQLQSMIKAMSDVVLPAIDPDNQLANEQAGLVLGMMQLMRARMPWQFQYDVDALGRAIELSNHLLSDSEGGSETASARDNLNTALHAAQQTLAAAKVSPSDLEDSLLELRSQTSDLVRALWTDGDEGCRQRASGAVLEASREQIERERAWFAPQGWDTQADAPAALESFFETPPGN